MILCNLGSGSKGNCTYISSGGTSAIIDDGFGLGRLEARAACAGVDLSALDAIVVTHEHIDHVYGVSALARAYGLPVYIHPKCVEGVRDSLCGCDVHEMDEGDFSVRDLNFSAFRLPHDSRFNLGYIVSDGLTKVGICTDLGYISQSTAARLAECKAVLLEANHDETMLRLGGYPYHLKKRISGDGGHLANSACAAAGLRLVGGETQHIILGHLSRENNTPELAYDTVRLALEAGGVSVGRDVRLYLTSQDAPSAIIEV